jgi:hypothetical protein
LVATLALLACWVHLIHYKKYPRLQPKQKKKGQTKKTKGPHIDEGGAGGRNQKKMVTS